MSALREIVRRNRAGERVGIYSVCSAHPMVLEAAAEQAVADGSPLLVEATCNQVNQEGGYTGLDPAGFRALVERLTGARGLPADRLILGGDHLGPNPWRKLPAKEAMARAAVMVEAYAAAGYTKLHLDCSMACADDPVPLPDEIIAGRAASLAAVAERHGSGAVYVVGTEVPVPGGATEALDHLVVTAPDAVARTLELHAAAFAAVGADAAVERIIAVVVQPGVEFGHQDVVDFDPAKAADLSAAVTKLPGVVFEAHSTDYQTEAALAALVAGHFAILKVGPGLTFALREALFALAAIEAEMMQFQQRSGLRDTLEAAMLRSPDNWRPYYEGHERDVYLARGYSLSDRCRYYWPEPSVAAAVEQLLDTLTRDPPPATLLQQYLPLEAAAVRAGKLSPDPAGLVRHHVRRVLGEYAGACGLL